MLRPALRAAEHFVLVISEIVLLLKKMVGMLTHFGFL